LEIPAPALPCLPSYRWMLRRCAGIRVPWTSTLHASSAYPSGCAHADPSAPRGDGPRSISLCAHLDGNAAQGAQAISPSRVVRSARLADTRMARVEICYADAGHAPPRGASTCTSGHHRTSHTVRLPRLHRSTPKTERD
jgi:hypothetical protein